MSQRAAWQSIRNRVLLAIAIPPKTWHTARQIAKRELRLLWHIVSHDGVRVSVYWVVYQIGLAKGGKKQRERKLYDRSKDVHAAGVKISMLTEDPACRLEPHARLSRYRTEGTVYSIYY